MAKSAAKKVSAATKTPDASAQKVDAPDWYDLAAQAVQEPGKLAAAHRYYKQYSLANRWLAAIQLHKLGLPLMPINTFGTKDKDTGQGKSGWLAAGRCVKKGEHAAIALVMPVPVKVEKTNPVTGEVEKVAAFNRFILRKHWFHLDQTEGEAFVLPPEDAAAEWTLTSALDVLEVEEAPWRFNSVGDLRLGAAAGRRISVSPLETHPLKGRLVQLARVALGHTEEGAKGVPEDAAIREVEANLVAYLVLATLGLELEAMEELRGELQAHLGTANRVPDKSAQRAFAKADAIINAGRC